MKNYTQRVLISGSLSGLRGPSEWASAGVCLVLLLFSIFISDLDNGEERLFINLQTASCWKCYKDTRGQEQEFKRISKNWKNDCNAVFTEFSVHFLKFIVITIKIIILFSSRPFIGVVHASNTKQKHPLFLYTETTVEL